MLDRLYPFIFLTDYTEKHRFFFSVKIREICEIHFYKNCLGTECKPILFPSVSIITAIYPFIFLTDYTEKHRFFFSVKIREICEIHFYKNCLGTECKPILFPSVSIITAIYPFIFLTDYTEKHRFFFSVKIREICEIHFYKNCLGTECKPILFPSVSIITAIYPFIFLTDYTEK